MCAIQILKRFAGHDCLSTLSSSSVKSASAAATAGLTQREYYVALRNKLFSIEEQLWLHEYAVSHRGSTGSSGSASAQPIAPLSDAKLSKFLAARNELLQELPTTKLSVPRFLLFSPPACDSLLLLLLLLLQVLRPS
jgi:hypothetical protein